MSGGDAENGKSIKQLYGSQRKLEDQKVSSSEKSEQLGGTKKQLEATLMIIWIKSKTFLSVGSSVKGL